MSSLGLTCPPDNKLLEAIQEVRRVSDKKAERKARSARFKHLAETKAKKTSPRRKKKPTEAKDAKTEEKNTDEKYFRRVVSPKKKKK